MKPKHIQLHWKKLRTFGAIMKSMYGAPVFLCGSALLDFNENPRDWDIRVVLSDMEFKRLYGDLTSWMNHKEGEDLSAERWKWSIDCIKKSQKGWDMTGLHIDFQIQPQTYATKFFTKRPKLKII